MFRVIFWNIYGKGPRSGIATLVESLVAEHAPDILALAECEATTAAVVLKRLNPKGRPPTYDAVPGADRVRMFLRGQAQNAVLRAKSHYEHKRFHIISLNRGPGPQPLLLVPVHMISLLEKDAIDIDQQLRNLAFEVGAAERDAAVGHQNTIVFGDFNAHPFSLGVAQHGGLHAVMSQAVAMGVRRQVVFNKQPMLFNPMWRFYGNPHPAPVGTYYREGKGDELAYFWNMFDQFMLRSALLHHYKPDSVRILTECEKAPPLGKGKLPLLKDGIPDREAASDHLPVMLTLHC